MLALCLSAVSALESMAFDQIPPTNPDVKAWFADPTGNAVDIAVKIALKPEFANCEGKAELTRLMQGVQAASRLEPGAQRYLFSPDLWDQYSFWCNEQWATKADLLMHAGPTGVFGKVLSNFTDIATLEIAFFNDASPFLGLRMLDSESDDESLSLAGRRPGRAPRPWRPRPNRPQTDKGCWNYPKPGTKRCPITPMNLDPTTDPRMIHYFNDTSDLDVPVVVVTKWTLKDTSCAARDEWIKTMRVGTQETQKEKGSQVYKWGQDVFDKNAFWGYEEWETKRDFIAHCTTGVFGQNQDYWLSQVDMLVAPFSGLSIEESPAAQLETLASQLGSLAEKLESLAENL